MKSTATKIIVLAIVALGIIYALRNNDVEAHTEEAHASWSYYGKTGPAYWGQFAPIADTGKEQSPINIVSESATSEHAPTRPTFSYATTDLTVINNGHTVEAQVATSEANFLEFGEKRYNLAQFHFHTASEHTLDGKSFPLEVHFVHQAEDKSLAVLGFFMPEGSENTALNGVFSNLPKTTKDTYSEKGFDLTSIINTEESFYHYDGSLTTPDCREGVKWFVSKGNIELSKTQIDAFKAIFSGKEFPEGNRRPVQAINSRTLYSL